MDDITTMLARLRDLFLRVGETGLALVALILLTYLLLGEDAGPYVISVVTNVSLLVSALSAQAVVAVILITGLYLLLRRN